MKTNERDTGIIITTQHMYKYKLKQGTLNSLIENILLSNVYNSS